MSDPYSDIGVPIGAPEDPNLQSRLDRQTLQPWAMGAIAAQNKYSGDVGVGMWPTYKPPTPIQQIPDTRVTTLGEQQFSPGLPIANRAADVAAQMSYEHILPHDPGQALASLVPLKWAGVGGKVLMKTLLSGEDIKEDGKRKKSRMGDVLSPSERIAIAHEMMGALAAQNDYRM